MKFHKYHALGNDYLVLDPTDCPTLYSPAQILAICHRNFGLGSDGILYGPLPSEKAEFGLQIWNPDGSEAEKSGNGLRIFAKFLHDHGRVTGEPFHVETPGGTVQCQVRNSDEIAVEMGQVSFHSKTIPVTGPAREVIEETMNVAGRELSFCAATIGNPHVVVAMDSISKQLACELGPPIENDTSRFPNRTNVQLLNVLDRHNILIEIWERGAGYTLASGSSSSAAAAVAHKLGLCDRNITVHCPGGDIGIEIHDDFHIRMTGPATRVGQFHMDAAVPDQIIPGG